MSLLITEHAVFDFKPEGKGMVLREIAPGLSLDELKAKTAAPFDVADDLSEMPC